MSPLEVVIDSSGAPVFMLISMELCGTTITNTTTTINNNNNNNNNNSNTNNNTPIPTIRMWL